MSNRAKISALSLIQSEPFTFIVALDPYGRVFMIRDMELVRKILSDIQSRKAVTPQPVKIDGYDAMVVNRHVEMLIKEGYLDGKSMPSGPGFSGSNVVTDLSWHGHDFIAALNNESVWAKIKQSFSPTELTTLPLTVLKTLGLQLLTEWAKSKVGL